MCVQWLLLFLSLFLVRFPDEVHEIAFPGSPLNECCCSMNSITWGLEFCMRKYSQQPKIAKIRKYRYIAVQLNDTFDENSIKNRNGITGAFYRC